MIGRRGTPLILLGAVLLLASITSAVYGRFGEWRHAQEVRSSAPPAEVLPERLDPATSRSRVTPSR